MSLFITEWKVLQNQYDSYEKYSLLIKCLAIILCVIGVASSLPLLYLVFIVCVLWLQDGIWKTFQSRIEQRLYIVEEYLAKVDSKDDSILAFQFNRQFLASRPNSIGLIKLYVHQSLRPTIAFPYIILLPLLMFYSSL